MSDGDDTLVVLPVADTHLMGTANCPAGARDVVIPLRESSFGLGPPAREAPGEDVVVTGRVSRRRGSLEGIHVRIDAVDHPDAFGGSTITDVHGQWVITDARAGPARITATAIEGMKRFLERSVSAHVPPDGLRDVHIELTTGDRTHVIELPERRPRAVVVTASDGQFEATLFPAAGETRLVVEDLATGTYRINADGVRQLVNLSAPVTTLSLE